MNHTYRLVWNVLTAGLGCLCIGTAQANPTGGAVVAGQGTINQNGNTTTVNQQSQNLSLNWLGFNIASNETVQFVQPSSSAVALNRVTGSEASQIYGHLVANGQVFLINPNGILFGHGAQVNVGGLVASTLNITDADFVAGNYSFHGSSSDASGATAPASVINQGTITATSGGSVALLGGQVSNQGVIREQLGSVALAAGSAMTLDFRGNRLLNVKVDQSAVGALAENRQLIQADGGTVIMTAAARDALLDTVVNNTGVIEARTLQEQGGEIKLLGSSGGGTVNVGGTLDASAANGGNGGTIETSGEHVKVADNTYITTKASQGQSGTWLIDPPDFTVAATGGDITGATLAASLDNGNVTILSSQGTVNTNGSGDINVNDDVIWSNGTKLTLSAVGSVNVNGMLSNTGPMGNGSAVTLRADSGGACVAGAAVCGTVNFTDFYAALADTVNIYYNPSGSNATAGANGSGPSYATPTDYSSHVDGTVSGGFNAYMLVNDVNQLQALNESTATRAGTYALGRDIDASASAGWNSGAGFVPIGNPASPFSGRLDGLGHTISGLTINLPSGNQVGLLAQTGANSVINNVGLVGGSVTGASNVGQLVGVNRGVIDNAFSTGTVTGSAAGGLVGSNQGNAIIRNSHATGNVTGTPGTSGAGGLVGWNLGAITDSYATGNVTSANARSGGLVGYMYQNASITRSFASGNVSSTNAYAGGLIGYFDTGGFTTANITDSYATGSVRALTAEGGLVGFKIGTGGAITRSYSTGAVTGTGSLGGLVGSWTNGTITGSFWDTQASGRSTSSGGGVGMTTAQMRTPANFTSATAANGNVNPGWDLAGAWRMYAGHTAPLLRGLLTPLTVTADNIYSTYNGNNSTAGLTNAAYSVAGAGTSGHLYGVATAYGADRNAGTYAADIWSDQLGYDITLVNGNLTINKAALVLTTNNVTKTYDGTTSAIGSLVVTGGTTLYGADSLSGGTFAYTTRDAGVGSKTVTSSGVTVNDGNGGNNYDVSYVDNTTSTINRATLTITAAANTKTYDATTTAAATPTVSGLQAGDSVSGLREVYLTSSAGTGKKLYVDNFALDDSNGGNNYIVTLVPNNGGVIDKANISITTSDVTKTYDGTTSAAGTAVVTAGTQLFGTDSISGGTFAYADKNTGTGNKVVTTTGVTISDGNGGDNYAITYLNNTSSTINPAALTITAAANTKTYDGTVAAAAAPTVSGLVGGDTVSGLSETYDDKNAGSGKTLSVTGYVINDSNGGNNYTVNTVANASGVINKADLVVTTSNVTKTYDGTTSAVGAAVATGGTLLYGADSLSGGTFSYMDKNAGNGDKTVTVAGVTVNDGNGGNNYAVTYENNTTSTITPATLTITAASNTKTYDGTTGAAAVPTLSGLIAGDTVTGLSEAYATKGAGTGKTLAVTGYVINDSNGGNNYSVNTVANTAGVIDKANLVLGASSYSKTYDGTTAAGGAVTASGNVAGDMVSATETYTSKNVLGAGGSTLRVVDYSVTDSGGADMSGNYNVVTTTAAGTISPALLGVSGATAANKTYDGTLNATVGGGVLTGVLAGDSVTLLQSGRFTDRNAGTNKVVTESFSLGGADAVNYALTSNTAQTTAIIVPATITVSGITANDKAYDATTAATLNTTSAIFAGKIGDDSLGISGIGRFSDANAGNSKTVMVSGLTLTGESGSNYVLAASGNESVTTASIKPVNVQVMANNQSKVAGAPIPELTLTYSGFVAGQNASSLATRPTVSTAATTDSPAGQYAITASGAADPNYTFSYLPGVLTITGRSASAVPSDDVAAYLGALASASHGTSASGSASGGEGTALRSAIGPVSTIGSGVDSDESHPFSEERAYEPRVHASDYLPILSLEILNGGLKLPDGVR